MIFICAKIRNYLEIKKESTSYFDSHLLKKRNVPQFTLLQTTKMGADEQSAPV